jgi:hypothetical protein
MNIYIHIIIATRRSDRSQLTTTVVSVSPSMEESIASVREDLLLRWPNIQYRHQQIMPDCSQQISQEVIDQCSAKSENRQNHEAK